MAKTDPEITLAPISGHEQDDVSQGTAMEERPSTGFLPIETNWFDRIFISVVIWVALCLLWLRLLEPAGLSLNFAHIIAILLGLLIVRKG